jgi:hypothetical protein
MVQRGSTVSTSAGLLHARAFTAAGVVHIPAEAGPLDRLPAMATLAHELTHLMQQQQLGGLVPDQNTIAGRALEAEALGVEHWVAGRADDPQPLRHLIPPSTPDWAALAQAPPAMEKGTQLASTTTPPPVDLASGVARQLTLEQEQPRQEVTTYEVSTVEESQPGETEDEQTFLDRLGENPPRRWLDLDQSDDLEELAAKLYERLHTRLRWDVIVQRERSGRLMDRR